MLKNSFELNGTSYNTCKKISDLGLVAITGSSTRADGTLVLHTDDVITTHGDTEYNKIFIHEALIDSFIKDLKLPENTLLFELERVIMQSNIDATPIALNVIKLDYDKDVEYYSKDSDNEITTFTKDSDNPRLKVIKVNESLPTPAIMALRSKYADKIDNSKANYINNVIEKELADKAKRKARFEVMMQERVERTKALRSAINKDNKDNKEDINIKLDEPIKK